MVDRRRFENTVAGVRESNAAFASECFAMTEAHRTLQAAPARSLGFHDEVVCWSRMQAEAGQPLAAIVQRKELERRANGGLFTWGVGNAPSAAIAALARAEHPIPVYFSIMKSRPRAVDLAPARTVAWRSYVDAYGAQQPLPEHSLVTSRGDSATGAKRAHYALICGSSVPLQLSLDRPPLFDHAAFCNVGGTGAPVGASQVTALLKRCRPSDSGATDYAVNLRASLTGSYWVKLTDPVELGAAAIAELSNASTVDLASWRDLVAKIRRIDRQEGVDAPRSLFW